jgi:carbon-monoxide dehydrogenase medium subunit
VARDVRYFAPDTLEEALQILGEYGPNITVLAGGTDLVRDMNLHIKFPDNILWIGRLRLDYVNEGADSFSIGAATSIQALYDSDSILENAAAIAHSCHQFASPPIRGLATIGGNLCNASPGADTAPALLGLGTEVVLSSGEGSRVVPLEDFFLGPRKTVLEPGELMTEIRVKKSTRSSFIKLGRRQGSTLAVLNVSTNLKMNGGGVCEDVRVAIGAAAPTPFRASKTEETLRGQALTEEAIKAAADVVAGEISPIDDIHGTAWYQRKVVGVLLARSLQQAAGLKGGTG